MNSTEYLVTLNAPPSLEEAMVDCLLTFESEHGFSSFSVNAHDHINAGLSISEQVTGRQKKIRFQMYILATDLPMLLEKLQTNFKHSGIQYWVLPVIAKGYI